MGDLATADDLAAWLGKTFTEEEETVAAGLLDDVEDALERATGRTFQPGGTVTDEPHSGRGTSSVKLQHPVDDLAAVGSELKVGADPADPDWTVDLTDPSRAAVDPDSQRRVWVRGATLPQGVSNVHVTYEAAAFLPPVARRAVLDVAATYWERKGGMQGVQRLRLGTEFDVTFERATAASDAWQQAASSLMDQVLG